MEKTDRVNGSVGAPEQFVINDGAVGKTFAIREATDEQLVRAINLAQQQHYEAQNQAMQLLSAAQNIAAVLAVFNYEMDRRRRSIAIVHALPS